MDEILDGEREHHKSELLERTRALEFCRLPNSKAL
jgi:hypothetical protein